MSRINLATSPRSFSDVDGAFCREEIVVRVIHFWEARNFKRGNSLIGFELLLIDAKSETMQGFISASRFFRYEHTLKANCVYRLNKFMLTPAKSLYRVSSNAKSVSFTDQTTLEVHVVETTIPTHSFRLRPYVELAAIADQNRDLFDVIGHIRFTDGDDLQQPPPVIPSSEFPVGNSSERLFFHLHMEDGETVRVNLWGKAACLFRNRWKQGPIFPSVILVTNINPRTYGAVTLGSTSSTRLFFDNDVDETKQYVAKFPQGDPHMVVNSSSSAITKLETVTIAELTHFLQSETPRTAGFYCLATIMEVGLNGWNYISCTCCKSKMEETGTSLVCTNNKCIKPLNVGLIRYRFEVSVSDTTGTATFVIFDDAAKKLIAKTAGDLMVELTRDGGHVASTETPQCLLDLVGRKCKFQIKVTDYNFKAIRQTFTVSRILEDNIVAAPQGAPPLEAYVNIADSNVHVRNNDVQVAAPPERPVPDINNNIPGVGENPMYTRNCTSNPFVASTTQPVGIASSSTSKEHVEKKQKLA